MISGRFAIDLACAAKKSCVSLCRRISHACDLECSQTGTLEQEFEPILQSEVGCHASGSLCMPSRRESGGWSLMINIRSGKGVF